MLIELSFLSGLMNAIRGSGYKLLPVKIKGKQYSFSKPATLLLIAFTTYLSLHSLILSILTPLPLQIFWWLGTGRFMQPILKRFHVSFIKEDYQWRAFEFTSVFVYCLVTINILKFFN